MDKIFIICGNSRTFLECFDSCYKNIINEIGNKNSVILFYLKLDDPGPKGQDGWNYNYKKNIKTQIEEKIDIYKINKIKIILDTDEINDKLLLKEVHNRNLFIKFLNEDSKLARAMQCHYNLYRCGEIIKEYEKVNNIIFNTFVYIRPDLYFEKKIVNYNLKNFNKIIVALKFKNYKSDLFAIVPRKYFKEFFIDRFLFYKTNTNYKVNNAEEIYFKTISNKYITKYLTKYYIKRT